MSYDKHSLKHLFICELVRVHRVLCGAGAINFHIITIFEEMGIVEPEYVSVGYTIMTFSGIFFSLIVGGVVIDRIKRK